MTLGKAAGYRTEMVSGSGGVPIAVDLFSSTGRPGERAYLLVHGLASNARLYDGVAQLLSAAGSQVAAVDLRGHGRSGKPDEGYDYDTLSADLAAVIAHLRADSSWPERSVVVGQSFGANLVLELAGRHPQLLAGVACIDGGTIDLPARFSSWEEVEEALRPPQIIGTPFEELDRRFRAMHPDWPEAGIRGSLANFEVRADGTVAPFLTLERHMRIVRTMWESSPTALYPQLSTPVLLMPVASPGAPSGWAVAKEEATERALESIPTARAHWFEGDHDIHAQHPDLVAAVLEKAAVDLFS